MIIFCHLLNDNSGSPRILVGAMLALVKEGAAAKLYVGSQGRGILEVAPIIIRRYWYRRSRFRIITLITYIASQMLLFMRLLLAQDLPRDAVVYVNTLLPFGAALWGRATGRQVIYHLHEVSVTPSLLRWFLTGVAARTANSLIYVSEDHRARLPIPGVPTSVVLNPISPELAARAVAHRTIRRTSQEPDLRILMLASPRDFKGVPELLDLARRLSSRKNIRFTLVLNGGQNEVDHYLLGCNVPHNLVLNLQTDDPADFYERADLLVNLSRVDLWIETFGLTLIEAMAFGLPVIAPPIGGPAEIVTDGQEGWLIDSRDLDALTTAVLRLADDHELRADMSAAAIRRSEDFSFDNFAARLEDVVVGLKPRVGSR